jgi:CRP-like cAMP-binding protein
MLVSESLAGALTPELPIALDPLFAGAAPLRLAANELLYMPEEPARQVYQIVAGEVRLYKINAEGREFTLGIYSAGDLIGEAEALTGTRRACYAMARGPAQLLAQDTRMFLQMLARSPDQALLLARVVSRKNRLVERKMESLLFKSAHAKVAEQLLALAEQHAKPAPERGREAVNIDYPITHQEIANLIGATRETVSYVLLDFKAMALIDTGRRRIAIRDLAGLKGMAMAS